MNTAPPRHFRPLSDRQRRDLLARIDAAEREALHSEPAPLTADPYLLRTPPESAAPQASQRRNMPPLRLIKPAEPASHCSSGTCPITPGCAGRCYLDQAHQALRKSIDERHPELPPPVIDHGVRRLVVIGLLIYAAGCFAAGAWLMLA